MILFLDNKVRQQFPDILFTNSADDNYVDDTIYILASIMESKGPHDVSVEYAGSSSHNQEIDYSGYFPDNMPDRRRGFRGRRPGTGNSPE